MDGGFFIMELDITYIAHIKTEGQKEQIVDLKIPELIEFHIGRENKAVELLEELGHTNVKRPEITDGEEMNNLITTSTFEGKEVTTTIHYTTALRAGNVGSKSGDFYYELKQLHNVVE